MEDDKEEEVACLITTQSARLSRAKDNRRSRGVKVRFSRPWRDCNYAQEGDSRSCSATFGNTSLRFCPDYVSYRERLTDFENSDGIESRCVSEQIFKKVKFIM